MIRVYISILLAITAVNAQFGGFLNAPTKVVSQATSSAQAAAGSFSSLPANLKQIVNKEWDSFKSTVGQTYATAEEELLRKNIFTDHRSAIEAFNKAGKSFAQALNPFSDLLNGEFNKLFNGYKYLKKQATEIFKPDKTTKIPDHVDWREKGAVTSVKNQNRGCSGCYAFASAGALEGHNYLKTGKLVDLSVQNVIDCSEKFGNNGCDGGFMNGAYDYITENKGVNAYDSYPYETKTSKCRYNPGQVAATCKGWVDIDENDEKAMEIAVATKGPITAAIDASKESFQFYSKGVYDDPECGNTPDKMNHGVLIVGYGKDADGKKYWLVKNSYGPEWGDKGYVKIAKENGNQCGIAVQASYPLV